MSDRRFLITLSSIALGSLVFVFWPFISRQLDFLHGDLWNTYQPMYLYIGNSLRQGRLPLWNDLVYTGMPQVAIPSPGIFYPINLFLFFLPLSVGLSFHIIFHQILFAVAMAFYLRRLELSAFASVAGGICTGLSGFMFATIKLPDHAGIAWTTALALMVSIFFRSRKKKAAVSLLAVVLCCSMLSLSGRPENLIAGLALAGVQVIAEIYIAVKNGCSFAKLTTSCCLVFLAFFCGIIIAAPALLPSLEWIKFSRRAQGLDLREVFQWSSNWYDWLSIAFWEPLGNLQLSSNLNEITALVHKDRPDMQPLLGSFYMGSAYCLAVCIGLSDWRWPPLKWLLPTAIFWALLAAGDQTPIAPALAAALPKLAFVRYPVKLLFIPVLLSVPAAARGLDIILAKSVGKPFLAATLLLQLLLLVFFNSASAACCDGLLSCMSKISGVSLSAALFTECKARLIESINGGLLLALPLSMLIALYQRGLIKKRLMQLLLFGFLILPLIGNGISARAKSCAYGFYEHIPAVSELLSECEKSSPRRGRVAMATANGFMKIEPEIYKKLKPQTEDPVMAFMNESLEYNNNIKVAMKCSSGHELGAIKLFDNLFYDTEKCSADFSKWTRNKWQGSDLPFYRFCVISATDYVITRTHISESVQKRPLDPAYFKLLLEDSHTDTRIYRLLSPAQRFYFAEKLVVVNNWEEFAHLILNTRDKDSVDLQAAYCEGRSFLELKPFFGKDLAEKNPPAFRSGISLISETPECISLKTEKSYPGLLVIRDQYYPGWKAKIDGKEVPVIRVNLINRAVPVPEGEHKVVMEFCPESFYLGCKLALAGFLGSLSLCFVLLLFESKKKQADSL